VIWLRVGTVEDSCEHGTEPSGSITFWEVIEWAYNWRPLEKGVSSGRLFNNRVCKDEEVHDFWSSVKSKAKCLASRI
jgi:hypothetical protein